MRLCPALKVAVSRVFQGFSRRLPPHPALSRISQISCLPTAINLLYFLPTAGISLFAHRKNGYLDKAVLRAAIPTGTLCALAAAFLTTMVDSSVFRKPFGLFLLYAGLSILFEKKENSKKETP